MNIEELKKEITSFFCKEVIPYEKTPEKFLELWPVFGERQLFEQFLIAKRNEDISAFEKHLCIVEEVCKLSISGLLLSFLTQGWLINCIGMLAQNEYHNEVLYKMKNGSTIGSFCLTEPEYGSSYKNLKTRAVRKNDGWDIQGEKIYITNGLHAQYLIVVANTSDNNKESISLFLLPVSDKNVVIDTSLKMCGNYHSGIAKLKLNYTGVDDKYLLGSVGAGAISLPRCLMHERLDIAFGTFFKARNCLYKTARYLKQRNTDTNENLLKFQHIQYKLVDLFSKLDLLENYIYNIGAKVISGKAKTRDAIAVKVISTEYSKEIINASLELNGAFGYTEESGLMNSFMDIAPLLVGGGANNVLRSVLFKYDIKRV